MGLTRCEACGRDIPDFARVCEHCGHHETKRAELPAEEFALEGADRPPDPKGSFDFSIEHTPEPPAQASTALTPTDQPPSARSRRRDMVMVALAAVVGGAFTLALLMARAVPPSEVAAAPIAAAPSKSPASAKPAGPAWTSANSAAWADGRNSVAFEVQAENTVPIWMRTVRPILVVRCSSGKVEAFVYTSSAAKIEPQTDEHTVTIQFDDAAGSSRRWPDSEEHDALFAPDGASFAKQVAAAERLRFGFTPHNAPPVTAEFRISGLAPLMSSARECASRR